MGKDYFDYSSDLSFVEEYEEQLLQLRIYTFAQIQGITEEAKKEHLKKLTKYIENNSRRMSKLAYTYASVVRNANDWALCANKREEDYKYYPTWVKHTKITIKGYKDEYRSKILYSIIKRIFDIPFKILEAVIGYNIRDQKIYHIWMTYIIVFAFGLYIASQARELVEWGVNLYSQTNGGR